MDEREILWEHFRKMLLIRRFEEKAAQVYQQGKFGGFCHLYIGQEALVVGTMAALQDDDQVITAYRDHGHGLVRGVSADAAMAELYGKRTGCAGGKGGSMHFFATDQNFLGGWGIVGGQIPLAAGLAFACKYRQDDRITLGFLGDGAMPQGVVYETFNLAGLWDLPLVVVCENNRYAMGTPLERSNAEHEELFRRGEPFGLACHVVEAMDVEVVQKEMSEIVRAARESSRPQFVEARTYRFRGHSMSDPIHGHYRSKEEVEDMKSADPIAHTRHRLIEDFGVSKEDLEELDKEVKAEVKEAVRFAEESEPPEDEALYTNVYASS